jgi:hypothetical protein
MGKPVGFGRDATGQEDRTMTFDEIRTELMMQHTHLRVLIERAHGMLALADPSEEAQAELRAHLVVLAARLFEHNRREEKLLRGVLSTMDAWGDAREEIMNESHEAEHADVHAALIGAGVTSERPVDLGGVVSLVLDRVLLHMAREEKTFLHPEVLHDGGPALEQSSG